MVFDRYVYDALIAAQRSNGLPKWLYMWVLGHACPAPDLVLVLDAPGGGDVCPKGEESPEVSGNRRQGSLASWVVERPMFRWWMPARQGRGSRHHPWSHLGRVLWSVKSSRSRAYHYRDIRTPMPTE